MIALLNFRSPLQLFDCEGRQDSGELRFECRMYPFGLCRSVVRREQQVHLPLPWITILTRWCGGAWTRPASTGLGAR
jgi:hypothetical protein